MRQERINLWKEGEYTYSMAYGFQPNIRTYFQEDRKTRPCILIVPGGGYTHCSEAEGEIVAKTFYDFGFHTAVLTYTCNLLYMAPLKDQPLKDISRAMRILLSRAEEYNIDPGRIAVMGFSAGAHLALSLAVFSDRIKDPLYPDLSALPSLLVLCYPVISFTDYAHKNSIKALLGKEAGEEEKEAWSLEQHVTEDLCPVFLWQTTEDQSVPVENSYLLANALRKKNIPFEHHVFTHGRHGLSVSTQQWEDCEYGEEAYTLEQCYKITEQLKSGSLIPEDEQYAKEMIFKFDHRNETKDPLRVHDKNAAAWVSLCHAWLSRYWTQEPLPLMDSASKTKGERR